LAKENAPDLTQEQKRGRANCGKKSTVISDAPIVWVGNIALGQSHWSRAQYYGLKLTADWSRRQVLFRLRAARPRSGDRDPKVGTRSRT